VTETHNEDTNDRGRSQFALLGTRRFAPFFWTQFLGAFNDNVFRNALIIVIAFQASDALGVDSHTLVNIAAGLFILPFFLFSATAGQIADKFDKARIIRAVKLLEICIMGGAAAAFSMGNVYGLLLLLFLMGTQSTFFGPVKYSIIPQHLAPRELVGGNAMVEMGTFVSILLGTMLGGILVQLEGGMAWIGAAVCTIAGLGWLASGWIPPAPSLTPDLRVSLNPLKETWKTIQFGRRVHSVFLSILGISWFWFLGMAYLTQIPNFTRDVLRGDEGVVTLLLTMFSVGIGGGSLLCEKLSGRKVELGLVPLGSLGLSLFGIDLFLAYETPAVEALMGVSGFLATDGSFRVLADLVLIGVFGGLYIVPLFAFVQMRTEPEFRARVIAANNILNAFLMVLSTVVAILLLGVAGLTVSQFFLVLALANIAVAAYIYSVVPEFAMRFLIWILTHIMYRVRHEGLDRIPETGPAVLVSNHVSYVDGLIIGGACRRPIRFVVYEPIYRLPVIHFIFKTGKAIPITSKTQNPEAYARAFETIGKALDAGELICLFPEGKLTKDGEIDTFKSGIEKVVGRNPVPVIPMALRGLWGSFFSHKGGPALKRRPRRFWSRLELVVGEPMAPDEVTAERLHTEVAELRGDKR
jgi:1-acyl-sn-glycerol-3-phosphate acyltransferase